MPTGAHRLIITGVARGDDEHDDDRALFILSSNDPREPPVIDLTDQQKADVIADLELL